MSGEVQMKIWFLLVALVLFACNQKGSSNQISTSSGLTYEIIKEGEGNAVQRGDWIKINETTEYSNGTIIFSTQNLGYPVSIQVGAGQAVKGVEEGVLGMKLGEIRKLIVPPKLSRRSKYPTNLSPDSTLYYTIEVLRISKSSYK